MKTHTSDFKNSILQAGRQIDNIITRSDNHVINSVTGINLITNSDLFKTVMKELDFKCKNKITKDTIVNYQMGVKIDDDYEYLDYGNFIVQQSDWNADEMSYNHVCYDKMLYTMIDYNPDGITYPITVRNYINTIATKCGLVFANNSDTFVNYDKEINEDHFGYGVYTFRDVLDYLCEIVAGWFIINEDGELAIKYPTETNENFNKDFLRDTNITFKSRYGAVNSVVFSRGAGSDNLYRKDDNDINTNGLHEIKFSDNPFLEGTDRETFIDGVYNKLHGLEFYIMDVSSTGIGYLEVGDLYTFELSEAQAIKSGLYKSGLYKAQSDNSGKAKCLLLNDEMDLTSGLIENIYTDEPIFSTTDYKTSAPTDNSIKNAIITTNKNAGEIVLKVNDEGQLVQVQLKGKAEDGSVFNVKADNIILEGITTINNGFRVGLDGKVTMIDCDISGSVTAYEGSIGGWTINNNGLNNGVVFIHNDGSSTIYTVADLIIIRNYIMGLQGFDLPPHMVEHYDMNGDGQVTSLDYVILQNLIGINMS